MIITFISITSKNLSPKRMNLLKQVHEGITHMMLLLDWQPKGIQHHFSYDIERIS